MATHNTQIFASKTIGELEIMESKGFSVFSNIIFGDTTASGLKLVLTGHWSLE